MKFDKNIAFNGSPTGGAVGGFQPAGAAPINDATLFQAAPPPSGTSIYKPTATHANSAQLPREAVFAPVVPNAGQQPHQQQMAQHGQGAAAVDPLTGFLDGIGGGLETFGNDLQSFITSIFGADGSGADQPYQARLAQQQSQPQQPVAAQQPQMGFDPVGGISDVFTQLFPDQPEGVQSANAPSSFDPRGFDFPDFG